MHGPHTGTNLDIMFAHKIFIKCLLDSTGTHSNSNHKFLNMWENIMAPKEGEKEKNGKEKSSHGWQ